MTFAIKKNQNFETLKKFNLKKNIEKSPAPLPPPKKKPPCPKMFCFFNGFFKRFIQIWEMIKNAFELGGEKRVGGGGWTSRFHLLPLSTNPGFIFLLLESKYHLTKELDERFFLLKVLYTFGKFWILNYFNEQI